MLNLPIILRHLRNFYKTLSQTSHPQHWFLIINRSIPQSQIPPISTDTSPTCLSVPVELKLKAFRSILYLIPSDLRFHFQFRAQYKVFISIVVSEVPIRYCHLNNALLCCVCVCAVCGGHDGVGRNVLLCCVCVCGVWWS